MAKPLIVLVGLAAAAGAGYLYTQDSNPLATPHVAAALQPTGGAPKSDASASPRTTTAAAPSKKGAAGAAPVTVATATLADMPIVLSAPGTVEALATVAIKSRVDGQVVHVGFNEGDFVAAGSILYKLDDRLVHAQIRQAEAQIVRDQASLKDAMSIAERREALFQKKYASEAATETARQQVEVLKASIAAGQALLEMQRTQLDYLTVRAPISGRTGSMTAKLGAFVRSADPAALVTINQTKPITVAFAVPQVALQQLKAALETKASALIAVPGARPLTVAGRLSFVDNQVDRTTGTVTGKILVENADEALWPGQAVTVDLTVETRKSIVSVPASAVLPAQEGMIAWVIGADNRVNVRPVVQERVIGQVAFIASGLEAGERVVTDGQLRLSPGGAISIREPGRPGGSPPPGKGPSGKSGGAQPPANSNASSGASGG